MIASSFTGALPPPLRGRAGERVAPGGMREQCPPLRILRRKIPNDSNAILLCMGLFSTFLSGSQP